MATDLDQVTDASGDAPGIRRRRWLAPALVIVAFLMIGGYLGGLGGRLSEVQHNDAAAYLPRSSDAAAVLAESKRFTGLESTPAVLVYTRPTGITVEDQKQIVLALIHVSSQGSTHLAGPPIGPILSDDGVAAEVIVPFTGSDPDVIRPAVDWLRRGVADVDGLNLYVAGPAAVQTDLIEVYGAINVVLLLVTVAAVLLILVLVYRSPVLPFVVLACAGIALGAAHGVAYLLARADVITVSGQVQGILDVLVLGAGTDYALMLAARFREELRRREDAFDAMRHAWRAAAGPIAASAGTVIAGLLCLLISDLPSTRGLGPVAALGIAFVLICMLVLLPASLLLLGRRAFWPFQPAVAPAGADDAEADGPGQARTAWGRIAGLVGRRPRLVWTVTALMLGGLAVGGAQLEADGVPRNASFLVPVDSVAAQEVLNRHFATADDAPAVIITPADRLGGVLEAVRRVPGVAEAKPYVDPLEAYDRRLRGEPAPGPMVVDGRARAVVTVHFPADSAEATAVIRELRRAVEPIPDTDVGGYAAGRLDVRDAADRDRSLVIPLVLALVFVVLVLVLRSVVAPVLLVGTVVLSFLATMGVCAVMFGEVFGFAGAEPSFPLLAFVFLVALGVDYNIFLMTRVREEVIRRGHRAGTLHGLAVTGGVITSAGVVLAATFAALWVVPLVYLAELAFAVAFGVLLDTFIVRSLLVPALTLDLGRTVWWPSPLARP
jgi:RND superfamily putative drug exporter